MAKPLGLVQGQELEESAFIALKLQFKLNTAHWADSFMIVEWVDAGVILPDETLEFGRPVSQLR
jgi:hypothetical protein